MNWRITTRRYGSLPIGMHFLLLLLIVSVYGSIELYGFAPSGGTYEVDLRTWHLIFGLGILLWVTVRLTTRAFMGSAPYTEPPIPGWRMRLAGWMRVVLYVFMIGMPLLGWFAVSAKGNPTLIFGVRLPSLIGQDIALYSSLREIHKTIGTAGYYLIGLHTVVEILPVRPNLRAGIRPKH